MSITLDTAIKRQDEAIVKAWMMVVAKDVGGGMMGGRWRSGTCRHLGKANPRAVRAKTTRTDIEFFQEDVSVLPNGIVRHQPVVDPTTIKLAKVASMPLIVDCANAASGEVFWNRYESAVGRDNCAFFGRTLMLSGMPLLAEGRAGPIARI